MNFRDINPEQIEELKWENSLDKIAKLIGCNRRTLYRAIKLHDVYIPKLGEKKAYQIKNFLESTDRKELTKSINTLAKIIGVNKDTLRKYLDIEKVNDLRVAEKVLAKIKADPDKVWDDKCQRFKTRAIKSLAFTHDRISREVTLIISLRNDQKVVQKYDNVEEFNKAI